jgi:hypothetical protein
MGMEFTTAFGHFNIFPLHEQYPVPDHRQLKNWNQFEQLIKPDTNTIIILNHARDIHSGFRPFDRNRHQAIAGMALDNWKFPANAMEVINSGSLQNRYFSTLFRLVWNDEPGPFSRSDRIIGFS